MSRVAVGAVLALGGVIAGTALVSGCSSVTHRVVDASSAPTSAAAEEFCKAYRVVAKEPHRNASLQDLADVGTPHDIPTAARKGFVVFIDAASQIVDDDASAAWLSATTGEDRASALGLRGDEGAAYESFDQYVRGTCFTG